MERNKENQNGHDYFYHSHLYDIRTLSLQNTLFYWYWLIIMLDIMMGFVCAHYIFNLINQNIKTIDHSIETTSK